MVYLAILLILCGLLILITALSVESGIVNSPALTYPERDYRKYESDLDDEDIIFPSDGIPDIKDDLYEEDIFISFDDESEDLTGDDNSFEIQSDDELPFVNENNYDAGQTESVSGKWSSENAGNNTDGRVRAIMFDDRSNIIDYESGMGVIDPTFSKYKSIKRVGSGEIESDYDGINFYIDEKLYRFDFHKVYDIWSGLNYIALPLKGSSTVKLFIIENSAGFPEKVESNFKEYEKGL